MTELGSAEARKALQDHLEKYASDGLKREIDYEEAVWRSLPAFMTPLGLLAALLAYSFSIFFPDLPAPLSLAGMILAAGGFVSGSMTIWHLRFSVKSRSHRYPPAETEVCAFADHQRDELASGGRSGEELDRLVLEAVRRFTLAEIAAAATHNQPLNAAKLTARTKAARWLFWTTVFTLAAGALAAPVKILSGA